MPVRLNKKLTISEKVEKWALKYAHILLPLSIVVLFILFVLVCFAICGVSATESGAMRNFIAGGA